MLLTSLGASGEALGHDRVLKTNTVKRRVLSLFHQGCMLYDLIPTMPDARLRPLMQRFSLMLRDQPLFASLFGPSELRGVVRAAGSTGIFRFHHCRQK